MNSLQYLQITYFAKLYLPKSPSLDYYLNVYSLICFYINDTKINFFFHKIFEYKNTKYKPINS
jgi:hypothetical protein